MSNQSRMATIVIAVIGLIWNGMGLANFAGQIFGDIAGSMPESHLAIIDGRPIWATAGFGVAVLFGVLGCILLLMRKSLAVPVFLISLLAMVVQGFHTVNVALSTGLLGGGEILMFLLLPLLVGFALWWHARGTARKGQLS